MGLLDQFKFWGKRSTAAPTPARRSHRGGRMTFSRSILSAENTGRLESTWGTTPTEIDAFIYAHWPKLVARSRQACRTQDHARKYIQLCRDNIAGPTGFTLQPQITDPDGTPDKHAADAIVDAYAEWSRPENFTVSGGMSRADVERLAVSELARTGEFITVTRRGPHAGPWEIAQQIIDPIRLDVTHCEQLADGRYIKHGIEFNQYGRPLRYHFSKEPPGAHLWHATVSTYERDIVDAADVQHLFMTEWTGQKRGLPQTMTALARLRVLQNYEDAALVNADIGARKMGFIQDENANDEDVPSEDLPMDAEAGVFENIGNRKFVEFNPQYPTGEFDPFMKAVLRSIASGFNVSYNNLASDLTSVNFSSIRQGALDERELWKGLQQVVIGLHCDPIFRAWLPIALLSGRIQVMGKPLKPERLQKYLSCVFVGRRWGWIDPASEMTAAEKALALKIKSRARIMQELGLDPWTEWDQTRSDDADMKSLGIDPKISIPGAGPALPAQDPKADSD